MANPNQQDLKIIGADQSSTNPAFNVFIKVKRCGEKEGLVSRVKKSIGRSLNSKKHIVGPDALDSHQLSQKVDKPELLDHKEKEGSLESSKKQESLDCILNSLKGSGMLNGGAPDLLLGLLERVLLLSPSDPAYKKIFADEKTKNEIQERTKKLRLAYQKIATAVSSPEKFDSKKVSESFVNIINGTNGIFADLLESNKRDHFPYIIRDQANECLIAFAGSMPITDEEHAQLLSLLGQKAERITEKRQELNSLKDSSPLFAISKSKTETEDAQNYDIRSDKQSSKTQPLPENRVVPFVRKFTTENDLPKVKMSQEKRDELLEKLSSEEYKNFIKQLTNSVNTVGIADIKSS